MGVRQGALAGWRHLARQVKFDSIRRFASLFMVGMALSVAIAACSNGADN